MITCSSCSAQWTAVGRCHCSGCHNTFNGSTYFDAHRSQYGERGSCKDPSTLGYVQNAKGIWTTPKELAEEDAEE